jgi:hypothetical protein
MGNARGKTASPLPSNALSRTLKAAQKLNGVTDVEVRTDLPQHEKISNALAILLDSEMGKGARLAEYRKALELIAIAWNISLLPASERAEAIQKLSDLPPALAKALGRGAIPHIERLIARKLELFPSDNRWIVSFEANFREDYLHITAAAFSRPAGATQQQQPGRQS